MGPTYKQDRKLTRKMKGVKERRVKYEKRQGTKTNEGWMWRVRKERKNK